MNNTGYYFLTEWRDGSSQNHGMSCDEYFYNQIFEDVKTNAENKTLPFFNTDISNLPRELTTGKIINDENVIALEQNASKNKFKSNLWIYGDELEKLKEQGLHVTLKPNSKPVLCMSKYQNFTHLNESELYISEAGTKAKYQFLYNVECLDEISQRNISKYLNNVKNIDDKYTKECFDNFSYNVKENAKQQSPELNNAKKRIQKYGEIDGIDVTLLVTSQFKHFLLNSIGKKSGINNEISTEQQNGCYSSCSKLIESVKKDKLQPWEAGRKLTKSLEAGNFFARSCTAKGYNLEYAKKQEELRVADSNINHKKITKNMDIEY